MWDDENLYIGACLEEDAIWANVTKRDDVIFQDNDFEIFLSPEHTGHRYYEIEMNALNTVWDLFMDRPQRSRTRRIVSWDIKNFESAVKVEGEINNPSADNRYRSLEVKIPVLSLRECPADNCVPLKHAPVPGEIWRMNFSRVEWETEIKNNRYIIKKGSRNRPFPPRAQLALGADRRNRRAHARNVGLSHLHGKRRRVSAA